MIKKADERFDRVVALLASQYETRRIGPFTTRRIQKIVQGYREKAGLSQAIHPHLFRHQQGPDGRADSVDFRPRKQRLPEVYQHLSLKSVDKAYQDAVQPVGI